MTFEAVRLGFPTDPWYARVVREDGSLAYAGPGWASEEAATRYAALVMQRHYTAMGKRSELGNGDTCPLFPDHGNMYVLTPAPGKATLQYCPHADHDGRPRSQYTPVGIPRSRAFWPLFGFQESVAAYLARLDRAVREAALPDLSDLEVK